MVAVETVFTPRAWANSSIASKPCRAGRCFVHDEEIGLKSRGAVVDVREIRRTMRAGLRLEGDVDHAVPGLRRSQPSRVAVEDRSRQRHPDSPDACQPGDPDPDGVDNLAV